MEGDHFTFENSVQNNEEHVLFESRKYNFIVDATSNQGSFTGGQIQFVLDTLNSQSQWVDLREAVVEFPIKITAQLTQAAAASGGSITTNPSCGINSTVIKNGFHQWFDGAQLIVNGQTIQSLQQYENVAASFRILSSWSQDNLKKWGSTCGIALDDMTGDSTGTTSALDKVGLNNAATATVMNTPKGFDAVNNQASLANRGVVARTKLCNTEMTTSNVAGTIIGTTGLTVSGISNVAGTSSNTATTYLYSQFIMGTVRLRDLFDINEFPMVKNIRGFLYLNFNSFQVALTSSTGTQTAATIGSMSLTPLTGRSCPFLINDSPSGSGVVYGTASTTNMSTPSIITIVGNVNGQGGVTTGAVGSSAPLLTQARLVAPFYVANPRVDAALTKHNHKFSTYEKIVNPITCPKNQTINYIITVGVPNPRKLVLLPMWANLGSTTNLGSPEYSPFDTVPATSGPYAYLNQLQVYVANKPLFQYPINYDFEMWQSEIASNGLHGNVCDEMTSGLLTQQLWQENHRYYTIDLERRTDSEDGAAKSVQVSFTNPSTGYDLRVIAMVFYEKRWEIDTDICRIASRA